MDLSTFYASAHISQTDPCSAQGTKFLLGSQTGISKLFFHHQILCGFCPFHPAGRMASHYKCVFSEIIHTLYKND